MRKVSVLGAFIGWFAIAGQLVISLSQRTVSVGELLLRFIGFFTITTNTIVALSFTAFAFNAKSSGKQFFSKPSSAYAIAVFIAVGGFIYNAILRFLWEPQGFQLLIDELLHTVQPFLYIVFWLLFVPKDELRFMDFLKWLLYPLLYFLYVIILGAVTGHYPYPFFDVSILGYGKVLLTAVGVFFVFLLIAAIVMLFVKIRRPSRNFS